MHSQNELLWHLAFNISLILGTLKYLYIPTILVHLHKGNAAYDLEQTPRLDIEHGTSNDGVGFTTKVAFGPGPKLVATLDFEQARDRPSLENWDNLEIIIDTAHNFH